MPDALQIGPLALAWPVLLLLLAVAAGRQLGLVIGRRHGVDADADTVLWQTLLAALLVSRLVFVWQYRGAYLAQPWTALDLRDGGWSPEAGLATAWLFALSRWRDRPPLRPALLAALSLGSGLWLAGTLLLALLLPGGGQRLPDLALQSLDDGRPVPLAAFAGKLTVVNLWATWCPPCVREMPVLQQLQATRPDLHVVFINDGEPAERVRRWLAARRLPLHNVLLDDSGRAAAALDRAALPTTLFFDAQGRLVGRRIGELSAATLAQRLAAIQPPP